MLDLRFIKWCLLSVLMISAASLSAGCSSVEPLVMSDPSVNLYWPPKPDPQRIRYLRVFNGPEDIFTDKSKTEKFLEMITGDNRSVIELLTPSAVALSDDNTLYIADTFAGVIHRYDLDSRDVSYITKAGEEQLATPVALAVDADQNLYVADSLNAKVYKFDPQGLFIHALTLEGGFKRPTGIALTKSGEKFVVDALANKLHKFSRDDLYLQDFPKTTPGEELNTPSFVAVDRSGNVYVTDAMNFCVKLYDSEGNFVRRIGEAGDVPGSFARPKGIALDSDSNIYVVDANHDNIQIFNRDGQLLLYLGTNGPGPGQFFLPSGIFIDRRDRIFIADTFNRRVQVLQYLKAGGTHE